MDNCVKCYFIVRSVLIVWLNTDLLASDVCISSKTTIAVAALSN